MERRCRAVFVTGEIEIRNHYHPNHAFLIHCLVSERKFPAVFSCHKTEVSQRQPCHIIEYRMNLNIPLLLKYDQTCQILGMIALKRKEFKRSTT
jgi:hypothetical protein